MLSKQFHRVLLSEAALAEREVSLAEKTRELQRANRHIDAALHNMSQGLCMFDGDGRLLICNERHIRMYNLSANVIKPGCTLLEMIEHRRQRGVFKGSPTEYDVKIRTAARNKEKISVTVDLPDGRIIEVVNQPTADGGWVATHKLLSASNMKQGSHILRIMMFSPVCRTARHSTNVLQLRWSERGGQTSSLGWCVWTLIGLNM